MRSTRSPRVTVVCALCLAALVFTLAASVAACGDPYSGTWKTDLMGEELKIKIEKSGDEWVVSNPDEPGEELKGTEEDGKLVLKDADNPEQKMTLEAKDGKLEADFAGVKFTFEKE